MVDIFPRKTVEKNTSGELKSAYAWTGRQIPDFRNAVIVARDPGSAKKATSYAERLRLGIAVIHGEQKVRPLLCSRSYQNAFPLKTPKWRSK